MITLTLFVYELFTSQDSPTRGETRSILRQARQQIQQELGVRLVVVGHQRQRVRRVLGGNPDRYAHLPTPAAKKAQVRLRLQPPLVFARKGPPFLHGLATICGDWALAAIARHSPTRGDMLPFSRLVVTHELGHVLGAAHTTDDAYGGIMAASALPNLAARPEPWPVFAEESREQVRECLGE